MIESEVFSRTDTNSKIIGDSSYNLVIGMVLFWGFFINWCLVVNIDPKVEISINHWVFMFGFFCFRFLRRLSV